MNIAPVQKGVYTLGKRTEIPGMGKFDALSQMKVRIAVVPPVDSSSVRLWRAWGC